MVFHPRNRIYETWCFLISCASFFTSTLYAFLISQGSQDSISKEYFAILIICEVLFLVDIITSFFKAYDDNGDSCYVFDFWETSKKYKNSTDFKIDLFVWLPWGAFALIKTDLHEALSLLWVFKLHRFWNFLRIFEYQYYHPILKSMQINRINRIAE